VAGRKWVLGSEVVGLVRKGLGRGSVPFKN